ncbi:uncharacterized protein MONOS_4910 [Monocercomonoides exilis]|uniref:uncharacterized protein n=1 Tax=Monocercomonoides exilis TaxID=2049356 RepID=UPI003559F200|nr:hypothetical protein MONOS_4910 [Monocercomonoides exilis]|eukprot:MONOS_4910.1-p1 / transcript=MONOS_4910.1 / gene=MONOS_4910 / organism=Monocercomonoides_exilis_PA203 / gene_product=unspecified product / transcript_product=unspecified product / location=Mono_scaffold00137:72441-73620(+) / protein_length=358 / sequence_SO=supercontig / SO=protein_coding / is_pseudo=false
MKMSQLKVKKTEKKEKVLRKSKKTPQVLILERTLNLINSVLEESEEEEMREKQRIIGSFPLEKIQKQKIAKGNANKKATQKRKKKIGQMKRTNSHLKRKKSKRKRSSDEGSDKDDDEDEDDDKEEYSNEEEEDDDGEDESDDNDECEEGEEDEEATLREEIENEDLSKSKYVPFLGSSWLDQSFWERGDFCEQPSTTEKERTKERNQDFSFSTLFLSLFPSGYRNFRAVVTQCPLFFGNRLANPIEAVPLTLKLENVCGKMDASLEEQIKTKVNFIRLAENKIFNDDQSVTILSRTLRVFVRNTHKMLSEKHLSNFLVKGKTSSIQRKDGKKMNIVTPLLQKPKKHLLFAFAIRTRF